MNEDRSLGFSWPACLATVGFFVALWGVACMWEVIAAWLR